MLQGTQIATGEVRFPTANIIINDWWIVTRDRNIEVRDILSTEIVTKRYKVDWRRHFLQEIAIALGVIGIDIILYFVGFPYSGALLVIIFSGISRTWDLKKRAVQTELILNTRSGPVEIPDLKDAGYIEVVAKEINKRIALWLGHTSESTTLEPIRRTIRLATPPPSTLGPIKYKWARVVITDAEITLGDRTYPIDDVWGAEVRNESEQINWRIWARVLAVTIGLALVVGLIPRLASDGLSGVLLLIVVSIGVLMLLVTAKQAIDAWRRASKYILTVETKSGYIRAYATSKGLYLRIIARNINRAIRDRARIAADA